MARLSIAPETVLLQQEFARIFGRPPPSKASQEYLRGNLDFMRQGGLPPEIHKLLMEYPVGHKKTATKPITVGVKLIREWQGDIHEVQVLGPQQFLYRQQTYKSLSAIARQITGTAWNGHAFFGLRKGIKA